MAETNATVINVELPRTPRKSKPSIQQRLENSPARNPATPEQLQARLEKAERKRQKELSTRLQHAVSHNAEVEARSSALRERREQIIEVPVHKATPKRKPGVQSRLENSPMKVLTPDQLAVKEKRAEERRQEALAAKIEFAHAHLCKAKEVLEAQQQKKAAIIEVDVKSTTRTATPKRKLAIQKRLEQSPLASPIPTAETLNSKLAAAEERRRAIEEQRLASTRAELDHVRQVHDEQKARQDSVIVVDVKKCTPKRKPAVQRRLEFSPLQSPVLTEECLEKKLASAVARKLDFDEQRQASAKEHVKLVKARAAAAREKADKENVPQETSVAASVTLP
eukprot:CAMPEP_0177679746 /NCGR_PEP_ID=MMETSP0447-20121125/29775_1 /TAXON_ID=0 /ORGANISM="Stygamoeba regulata, Strain BSH-02190019" /LENGTH=336 /DNA_ID=CAMNT_0019188973 /DNA_START=53 /DNA_END=1063 /DNA_ORIENTATION=-